MQVFVFSCGSHGVRRYNLLMLKYFVTLLVIAVLASAIYALMRGSAQEKHVTLEEMPANFSLTSTAFQNGGSIPKKYTCQGENISPPLAWGGVPAGTQSL